MDPRETGLAPSFLSTRFAFSQWQSCQLLRTWPLLRVDNVGKQTFTITELSAADPDSHLFEVPDGNTVIGLRTRPDVRITRSLLCIRG